MITKEYFLDTYIEFSSYVPQSAIDATITRIAVETGGYAGLPDEIKQLAEAARVAHELKMLEAVVDTPGGMIASKVQSKDDRMDFSRSGDTFESTYYGRILMSILKARYVNTSLIY